MDKAHDTNGLGYQSMRLAWSFCKSKQKFELSILGLIVHRINGLIRVSVFFSVQYSSSFLHLLGYSTHTIEEHFSQLWLSYTLLPLALLATLQPLPICNLKELTGYGILLSSAGLLNG